MELDPGPALATAYYAAGPEEPRLSSGPGLLERARTLELLQRFLPAAPARSPMSGRAPVCTACGWPTTATTWWPAT